jgi:PAS domain S-box-containing protein
VIPWPYVFILLTGMAVHIGLGMYSRRFRSQPVQLPFELLMYVCAVWALTFALDISTDSLALKIVYMQIRFIGLSFVALLLMIIAIRFTGHGSWLTKRRLAFLLVIPAGTAVLALATGYTPLLRNNYFLAQTAGGFSVLGFSNGIWFTAVYNPFTYAMEIVAILLLLRVAFSPEKLYARQALFFFVAIVIPIVSETLFALGISPVQGYDVTTSTFAVTGLLLALAIFRYRFIDIVPVARSNLFDGMTDPMLVIDPEGRLEDFNAAAEQVLGLIQARDLGKSADEYLGDHAELRAYIERPDPARSTIAIRTCAGARVFDLSVSELAPGPDEPPLKLAHLRDVTDRRRAEEKVHETAEYLNKLIDYANAPIIVWNPGFRITRFNHAFERLTGRTAQEVVGQDLSLLFPETSRDSSLEQIRKTVAGERWEVVEIPIQHKSGETRIVLWNSANIVDPDGTIISTIAQGQDITDRKRLEEQVTTSEIKYRRFFEAVRDGILILDAETGTILDVNPFLIELLGFTRELFQGKKIWEIGLFGDIVANKDNFKKLQEKKYIHYENLPLEASDGRHISVEFISFVYDVDGRNVMQCNIRDITKRKEAESVLLETTEYLQNLLDYSNAPIIVWDPAFRITRFNHAFERLTGRTEQEVVGRHLSLLFPEASRDASLELIRKTLTGERWEIVEIPIQHKSGETRIVLWNSANIADPQGTLISTIAQGQDITDRKMTEVQREALIRELEQKNAELERFTYTVSHDLKSPLITIKGFASLLDDDALRGDPLLLKKDIDRITTAADTMLVLLNDLLELSRIGRVAKPPEKTPFGTIAREAVELLAGPLAGRGVTVEIAPDLPDVYVDHTRIREVMVNLIENAIKFAGDRPDPVIRIGVEQGGERPVFFVQDNGIGINPTYLERVFNLFERLDVSTHGTGIGLTIARRVIEVHGGKIWAESEGPGKGTTFRFTLPGVPAEGVDTV